MSHSFSAASAINFCCSSHNREDKMTDTSTNMRLKLPVVCFILEIILIILFGTLVQYNYETDAKEWHNKSHEDYENDFYYRYPSE